MIKIHAFLKDKKSRMILTIHDELVFEIAHEEYELVPILANIMKESYKFKYLPLEVDIEWSDKNLAEKYAWTEYEKRRNEIQRVVPQESTNNTGSLGRENSASFDTRNT
jgi:hypothetical protein